MLGDSYNEWCNMHMCSWTATSRIYLTYKFVSRLLSKPVKNIKKMKEGENDYESGDPGGTEV